MIYITSTGIPINVQHITHLEKESRGEERWDLDVYMVSGMRLTMVYKESEAEKLMEEEFDSIKFAMEHEYGGYNG